MARALARRLGRGIAFVSSHMPNPMMLEQRANFSRYFGDKDIEGMFATLGPLHDLLAKVSRS